MVIYHHPLAYLIGMEGLALLRAWAGDYDYDEQFVTARLAEVRRLLDDERLTGHPGVLVERGATEAAYRQWSASYDKPNGLFDLDEPLLDEIIDRCRSATPSTRRAARVGWPLGWSSADIASSAWTAPWRCCSMPAAGCPTRTS